MEYSRSGETTSFSTQANALMRKNLAFEKRNMKKHIGLAAFPIFLCVLLAVAQITVNIIAKNLQAKSGELFSCGCICLKKGTGGKCRQEECGIQYSDKYQARFCDIPHYPTYPPVMILPKVWWDIGCRSSGSCPMMTVFTGGNRSFAESLAKNLYNKGHFAGNSTDQLLASTHHPDISEYYNKALDGSTSIYSIQPTCSLNISYTVPVPVPVQYGVNISEIAESCLPEVSKWRESSTIRNDILKRYVDGNPIVGAYDFLNSSRKNFNVSIMYNRTTSTEDVNESPPLMNAPSLLNAVSNSYLQLLLGADHKVLFEYVKQMPTKAFKVETDFLSTLGPLLFTWVILQLFPVILSSMVYEKQQKLRIMMKMHGLADVPYWMISYAYYLTVSVIYVLCLVVFGSILGLKFFRKNSYSLQFVFYFIFCNLQTAQAFLGSTIFSSAKVATVTGHLYALGSGLIGQYLLSKLIVSTSFPSAALLLIEMIPCFSLYRGMFEFAVAFTSPDGMQWKDLSNTGMGEVLVLMLVEWCIFLLVTFYLDQVVSTGSGIRKHPLFFLENFKKRSSHSRSQVSEVSVNIEKNDVSDERKKVEDELLKPTIDYAILCDNLKKMYPSRDGNPEKHAVRGLSLAIPRGECFGMLGPNGAGKTSSISMMIGLMYPSSGTVFVNGLDIKKDKDKIYTTMGVCPQHDLLWESLTGREHLLFYGRLKNLTGDALTKAVDESLKSVNLYNGGVGDKQAGKYSGGMKRRLSVAIALIGNPKVVYMDEPSTGLDPASRNILWDVVKRAKQNCAIILTTHSMEEAEALCDRLGVCVDGSLQCIGDPNELKARYGGSYVFTMTTSSKYEKEVENMVLGLSPDANKVYHLSGTQKFEIPKDDVRIADVFEAVENVKRNITVYAWGISDTTLEDVFIKVANEAHCFIPLT